jgi:alpha,alpha-trehalose phosphorylase
MLHHERLRPPSHDYPADEWNVIEKNFHPEFLAQLETMSSLGNGYLGPASSVEQTVDMSVANRAWRNSILEGEVDN